MSYKENREQLSDRSDIVDLLSKLARVTDVKESADVEEALLQLAHWRESLSPSPTAIAPSSLCSNCSAHITDSRKRQILNHKPPVELWLEVETRCNLSCRFCYNFWRGGIETEPTHQPTDILINGLHHILDSVDCQLLSIAGGEPLLRHDLTRILFAIKPYSIPIALATNGVLLTPEKIHELKSAGVGVFQIPLHSHAEQVHDTLSAGRSWRKTLQAIVWLRELGAQVVPVFVATTMNLSHFPQVLSLCRHLGLDQIIFNRFVPTGQGSIFREHVGVPNYDQLIQILQEADTIAVQDGIRITLGVPLEVPSTLRSHFQSVDWTSCPVYKGQRRWAIGADLQIRRCNSFATGIGSLLDGGLESLLSELRAELSEEYHSEFRSCQLINAPQLVQIGA